MTPELRRENGLRGSNTTLRNRRSRIPSRSPEVESSFGRRVEKGSTQLSSFSKTTIHQLWVVAFALFFSLAIIFGLTYVVVEYAILQSKPGYDKEFIDLESPSLDIVKDTVPFIQDWYRGLHVDDGGKSLVAQGRFKPEDCARFEELQFTFANYTRYPEFFRNNSVMALAEAGSYVGPADIEEYVGFADEISPYFQNATLLDLQLRLKGFNLVAGTCDFVASGVYYYETNSQIALSSSLDVAFMARFVYDIENNYLPNVNIYYEPGFLDLFFGTLLSPLRTRTFICNTIQNRCPEIYNLNGQLSESECIEKLNGLPLFSQGRADGLDYACRVLHTAFVANGGSKHCPHISFAPSQDENGNIKCQQSELLNTSDLHDEVDIELFRRYISNRGLGPGGITIHSLENATAISPASPP